MRRHPSGDCAPVKQLRQPTSTNMVIILTLRHRRSGDCVPAIIKTVLAFRGHQTILAPHSHLLCAAKGVHFFYWSDEARTDDMLTSIQIESHRRLRRDAQRSRRARENSSDRESRRKNNTAARRTARNTAEVQSSNSSEPWWVRMAQLNSSETKPSLGLHWNRTCKHCGIKVLTGERCHDRCFVCGPKGSHYLPLLPLYPEL
ncbi:hypothetical protein B0H10DRAFT_827437 [Mycena sp. CBHHK59/15]|nr:hypothetical protein B0H10DRAFT_1297007 [Mycena sp. CBHHK59/15]KAJ6587252.1 hypothetical protein B0H10DRAFT_827437 [Mycena sp. CBHHK59/15]